MDRLHAVSRHRAQGARAAAAAADLVLSRGQHPYVRHGRRKAGIWFFSLDAESDLAVEAARRIYKLPYFRAEMRAEWRDGRLEYESRRRGGERAALRVAYRPIGDVADADPRSLAHFLTERYCLYAEDAGRLKRAEIHHAVAAPGRRGRDRGEHLPPSGIELLDEDPLLHFSARQDVVIWPLGDA